MIKCIDIRSNGTILLKHENGATQTVDLLNPLLKQLMKEGLVTPETEINTVFCKVLKVSDWYEISTQINKETPAP